MKVALTNLTKVVYLGRFESPFQGGVSYNVSIKTDTGAGELKCTKEVYDELGNYPEFCEIGIAGDFDTNYKTYKVSGVKRVAK